MMEFKEECTICENKIDPVNLLKKHLHNKYFDQFNFYFAKPIKEILANITISHVIQFKDYLFYDDFNEYLKRFY